MATTTICHKLAARFCHPHNSCHPRVTVRTLVPYWCRCCPTSCFFSEHQEALRSNMESCKSVPWPAGLPLWPLVHMGRVPGLEKHHTLNGPCRFIERSLKGAVGQIQGLSFQCNLLNAL